MEYLIDGYNLFFYLYKQESPEDTLSVFIEHLNEKARHSAVKFTLVFDNRQVNGPLFPSHTQKDYLSVVFAPTAMSADDYILEQLNWEKNLNNKYLITSDRALARKAREKGIKTKSVESFLQEINKTKKKNLEDKKEIYDMPRELNRLLRIFKERLDQEK